MPQIPNIGNISTQMLSNAQKVQMDQRDQEAHDINMQAKQIGMQNARQEQEMNQIRMKEMEMQFAEKKRQLNMAQDLRERMEANSKSENKQHPKAVAYGHAEDYGDIKNMDYIHDSYTKELARVYKTRDAWERAYMNGWAQKKHPLKISKDGKNYLFENPETGEEIAVPRDVFFDNLIKEQTIEMNKANIAKTKASTENIRKKDMLKAQQNSEKKIQSARDDLKDIKKRLYDINKGGSIDMDSPLMATFLKDNPNLKDMIQKGDPIAKKQYTDYLKSEEKRLQDIIDGKEPRKALSKSQTVINKSNRVFKTKGDEKAAKARVGMYQRLYQKGKITKAGRNRKIKFIIERHTKKKGK